MVQTGARSGYELLAIRNPSVVFSPDQGPSRQRLIKDEGQEPVKGAIKTAGVTYDHLAERPVMIGIENNEPNLTNKNQAMRAYRRRFSPMPGAINSFAINLD